jgi:hypothetical protein
LLLRHRCLHDCVGCREAGNALHGHARECALGNAGARRLIPLDHCRQQ